MFICLSQPTTHVAKVKITSVAVVTADAGILKKASVSWCLRVTRGGMFALSLLPDLLVAIRYR